MCLECWKESVTAQEESESHMTFHGHFIGQITGCIYLCYGKILYSIDNHESVHNEEELRFQSFERGITVI